LTRKSAARSCMWHLPGRTGKARGGRGARYSGRMCLEEGSGEEEVGSG